MQIIQFENRANQRAVAKVEGNMAYPVKNIQSVRDLALLAIRNKVSLEQQVEALGFESETYDYSSLLADLKVLPPLDHPDPTHCLISGTGLTHLGSASARDKMHQQNLSDDSSVTDTMRIFQWGLQNGRPAQGQIGAQPEWFYKGDGSIKEREYLHMSVKTYPMLLPKHSWKVQCPWCCNARPKVKQKWSFP